MHGRLIEHEPFLGDATYTPTEMLDDTREMLRGEVERAVADGGEDRMTRIHLEDVLVPLDRALED